MATSAQITPFSFNTHAVRVIVRDGAPWFVASDVCSALEYSNASDAVATHLDDDERMTIANGESHSGKRGGARLMTIINESGLYALVLRSRKPEARKFAKWVTAEVLPAIRKTGRYEDNRSGQRETLNVTLARMADQLDQPNSYPVQLFLPLLHAINRKLLRNDVFGVTMSELVDVIEQSRPLSNLELANLSSACTNRLAARINPAFQHLRA